MIKIGSKSNLNQLASQHWTWLEEKLMLKSSYMDLVKKYKEKPSNAIKKNRMLRKMLKPKIFSMLHDIVTKKKEDLLYLKSDPNFIYFFPYDDEYLHCAQREYDEAKKAFDEYKHLLKKRKKPKSYKDDLCNLENDKKQKKINLEDIRKFYDEDYKDFAKKRNAAINARAFFHDKSGKLKKRKENIDLVDLLRYDELHSDDPIWNANLLCESLGIDVCPYCNRQYIFIAKKSSGKGWVSSAQLDHFLPKSNYPLFSNSFFNLIPSCYCCNHSKSDNVSETIYPYEEEFGDDGRFALDFVKENKKIEDIPLDSLIGIDFDINEKSAYYVKIENSKNVFHLTELYSKHQLDIKDFIKRYRYLQSLTLDNNKFINDELNKIFRDEKESVILGFPLNSSCTEYPLRKMKHDLLKQLKDG